MTRSTSSVLLLTALILLTILGTLQAQAQSAVELKDVATEVRFGEQITFFATIRSAIPLQNVSIVISDEASGVTHTESLTVQPDGRTEFRLDTRQNRLHSFTMVNWSYRFTFSDGSTAESEVFSVRYADNRFHWQELASGSLRVHWYHGDSNFGQSALDAARAGLEAIGKLMPTDLAEPMEVYVYASADDLGSTLTLGGDDWVAGHADPALGIVMVFVEPGREQSILMEQRIPHELMHVMLYRRVGTGYDQVPTWFREGMSAFVELYPNADYDRVLADAAANNRLIPFTDLCDSFPSSAGQAFLAYAQARSFITYLYDTYGSTGLQSLATSYADGLDCERGPERALGVSLFHLERKWRSEVWGQDAFLPALQGISPYLVLLCLVLLIPSLGILITLRNKGSHHEPETYVRK